MIFECGSGGGDKKQSKKILQINKLWINLQFPANMFTFVFLILFFFFLLLCEKYLFRHCYVLRVQSSSSALLAYDSGFICPSDFLFENLSRQLLRPEWVFLFSPCLN